MGNEIKNVLITGAAVRIGRAIALEMVATGWSIAVHYNSSAREAEALVAEIENSGGAAKTVRADLADEDETAALVELATEAIGPLSCLINNASMFEFDTVELATRESWDLHMNVNLRAPFLLSQAFATSLGDGQGNIVNIIDQRVWSLTPHFMTYTLSKSGLWTLTRTLAMALAPRIRVNAIGPGPTFASSRQSGDAFQEQWSSTPLARQVDAGEIAKAVRFILDAKAMTGQMIALDSGQHLGWRQESADKTPDLEPDE